MIIQTLQVYKGVSLSSKNETSLENLYARLHFIKPKSVHYGFSKATCYEHPSLLFGIRLASWRFARVQCFLWQNQSVFF